MLKTTIHSVATFFGWLFISTGAGGLVSMLFGYFFYTPKACIIFVFIGIGILIAGQKKSEITFIEFVIGLAITSILIGNSQLFT